MTNGSRRPPATPHGGPASRTPPRPGPRRTLWPVVAFTAAYLLASIAAVFARGNREFVFYIAVMLALIAVLVAIDRRVRLTVPLLWALSIWGLAHMAGGLVPVPKSWPINGHIRVLYSWWLIRGYLKYDHVVHAYGFGVTTWGWWQILRPSLTDHGVAPRPTPVLLMLCAAAAMGCGAGNEVVEFFATLLVPETNVGGYVNTGWDLVSNGVGATIAAVWIGIAYGKGRATAPQREVAREVAREAGGEVTPPVPQPASVDEG